jgi:hypothetical protein
VRAKAIIDAEAGTVKPAGRITKFILRADSILEPISKDLKSLQLQIIALAIALALVLPLPVGIYLLFHFKVWPFDASGNTAYAYACVQYVSPPVPTTGWSVSHWTLAPYENGICTGSEHLLEGGVLRFTTDVATQRVVAMNDQSVVMKLDRCSVFDQKNWSCSYNDFPWMMKNGQFYGEGIYAGDVAYADFWDRFSFARPLKPSDIQGL